MEKLVKAYNKALTPKEMPQWLINSFRTGYQLKDKAIIIECHNMWQKILEGK